jgi:hypothetical protein
MKSFTYDTRDVILDFWNMETPKLLKAKYFLLDEFIPYLKSKATLELKHYNVYSIDIKEHKAIILDSGDYKRVYFFFKSEEDFIFNSKLNDYEGKYLMTMFLISDDNYYEHTEVIEKYMYKVFDYLIEKKLNEMIWNTIAFKRPDTVKINVHYNEIKEQKPISMDYVDAMFNVSVLSSYLNND